MKFVFGPVPSRRLGRSLGVDPIPFKTCNHNCVYCQLGRTTPVTHARKDFFPPGEIVAEVRAALDAHPPGEIDYVTFVGEGEPLLCASLGRVLREVRAMTEVPIAVITNGSLLTRPEVRDELCAADLVMPTLNAADQATFRRIDRASPKLEIAEIIAGMAAFREIFDGRLWLEIMLIKGVNDTEPVLRGLAEALRRIRPDQVHLNVPIRPPAEDWVKPPDEAGLVRAMVLLGDVAPLVRPAESPCEWANGAPGVEDVIDVLRRHPMGHDELVRTLERSAPGRSQVLLEALESSPQARRHVYQGQLFWVYADGRFAAAA